jgi:hypothetical protein
VISTGWEVSSQKPGPNFKVQALNPNYFSAPLYFLPDVSAYPAEGENDMKIGETAVILIAMAGTASARNIEIPNAPVVPVCMENVLTPVNVFFVRSLAAKMFATAGVNIEWRKWDHCPAGAIRIVLSQNAPETIHPKALAYAQPYEGTWIVIFLNRVAGAAEDRAVPYLLAHVMVHEITHILQGICRHSETGIMKPVFGKDDIDQMELHPMTFEPADIELLQIGIRHRQARLIERVPTVAARD